MSFVRNLGFLREAKLRQQLIAGGFDLDSFLNTYKRYFKLTRLDKPVGILLLMWPTLWALFIASQGFPDIGILIIFVLGVIFMRSAGCIVNDIIDINFDKNVSRTKDRMLANKKVSLQEAVILMLGFLAVSGSLLLSLNSQTIGLALGALALTLAYPFFKRFFLFPQAILGIAFGFGILMAFYEIKGAIEPVGWTIFIANFFWAIAYDTIYALSDIEDDKRIGLKSSAITLGANVRLGIYMFQSIFLLLMIAPVTVMKTGVIYGFFWFLAALYSYYLLKNLSLSNVNYQSLFQKNQRVGAILFLGIFLDFGIQF